MRFLGRAFKLHTFKRKKPPVLHKEVSGLQEGVYTRYGHVRNRPLKLPRGHFPKRRKGGCMQNGTRSVPGTRWLEDGTVGGISTKTAQLIAGCLIDNLSNVSSVGGDFKKPNPQSFTHTIREKWHGSYIDETISNGKVTHIYSETGQGLADYVAGVTWQGLSPTVYNKALNRLYDKLRGDIDVSIDLAESHKTKSMMRDTVKAMSNLAVTFRKMKRSNPRDWGNLWLEYTYGWKPLVSTIYGAGSKLMGPTPQGMGFLRVTASAWEQVIRGTFTRTGGWPDVPEVTYATQVCRCRFQVHYQLPSSVLTTLAGYTSLNPISIAWELTPYSFVVDWFVNFGGYLRDFENALLYRTAFLDGYYTEGSLGEAIGQLKGVDVNPHFSANYHRATLDQSAYERVTRKNRAILTSSPFPRPPKFDPHLGASRLISGAALLGQMLTSLQHSKGWGHPEPSASERRIANAAFEKSSKAFTAWSESMRVSLGRSRLRP